MLIDICAEGSLLCVVDGKMNRDDRYVHVSLGTIIVGGSDIAGFTVGSINAHNMSWRLKGNLLYNHGMCQ